MPNLYVDINDHLYNKPSILKKYFYVLDLQLLPAWNVIGWTQWVFSSDSTDGVGGMEGDTSSSSLSPVVHSATTAAQALPTVNSSHKSFAVGTQVVPVGNTITPKPFSAEPDIHSVADISPKSESSLVVPSVTNIPAVRTTATAHVCFADTLSVLVSSPCSPTATLVTKSSEGSGTVYRSGNSSSRVPFRISFPSSITRAPFLASYRAPSSAPTLTCGPITARVPAPDFRSQCNSPCDVCDEYYPNTACNSHIRTYCTINTGM